MHSESVGAAGRADAGRSDAGSEAAGAEPSSPNAGNKAASDGRFVKRDGWRDYAGVTARGLLMGSADVVPGVSGGTIAFITGIYTELIYSLKMVGSSEFLRPALRLQLREAWHVGNLTFLIALMVGIAAAVLTLAPGIEHLLETQPVLIWSFFFGLVSASVLTMLGSIPRWSVGLVAAIVLGAAFAWWLVGLVPRQTPEAPWFLILSGALAICAMILPGISGSFILLLLGKYEFVLAAVNDRNLVPILWVGLGAVIGIVTFAKVLNWLFKRWHDATVAVLIGFMIGSMRKVWPWKVDGVAHAGEGNMLPALQVGGAFNSEIVWALAVALLGVASVLIVERVARSRAQPA
jgi:putative membrane protein